MARIDASTANEFFAISDPDYVSFLSHAGAGTTFFHWNTPFGSVHTTGTGYTYGTGGAPTGGIVNRIEILLSNTGPVDIVITGFSAPLQTLANIVLLPEEFADAFWGQVLKDADLIIGPNNQTFSIGGDALSVLAGTTLIAQPDRIIGGTVGSGQTQTFFGDFVDNEGTVVGGNDIITGGGNFIHLFAGDGNTTSGLVVGGDDVLATDSTNGLGPALYGDVQQVTEGGIVVGGNDRITGSDIGDQALVGDVSINLGRVIGGNDIIHGRGGDDTIIGDVAHSEGGGLFVSGGNDQLFGDAGNDGLAGNLGSDLIDGGADNDTAFFTGLNMTGARFIRVGGTTYVSQIASPQLDVDTVVNVETINTPIAIFSPDALTDFAGLNYVATYADLANAFRSLGSAAAINAAGAEHFAFTGYFQGRLTEGHVPFDPVQYKQNYSDLAALTDAAAAGHFIVHGSVEGRLGFDAMAYIASYADLRAAFRTNEAAALAHYHNHGRAEGRKVTFDARQYAENYSDLSFLASNPAAAAQHYVAHGASEGRVAIDPLDYVASYADLIQAFGDYSNAPLASVRAGGLAHYINHGRAEGRTVSFDAFQYLLNYQDLREAFGTNVDLAAHHFTQYGFYEGRTDDALFA